MKRGLPFELDEGEAAKKPRPKVEDDDEATVRVKRKASNKDASNKDATDKGVVAKLVVAMDFGTTHSGLAWQTTLRSDDNDQIQTVKIWLGMPGEQQTKIKSSIAYASENQAWGPGKKKLDHNAMGPQVKTGMNSYTWFKLGLDDNADPTEFDDPQLKSAVGEGVGRLPPGKSHTEVCGDYLQLFWNYAMSVFARDMGQAVLDQTPIKLFVTVPAIWNDRAMRNTKNALRRAGCYDREFDTVEFVSEPEAAAVATLKQFHEQNTKGVKTGMTVVVADLGGGTIDAESMKVECAEPLKLRTIGIGEGGKCGSTTIDRAFIAWMVETFGEAYEAIPEVKKCPGSNFMNSFEDAKRSFQGDFDEVYRIPFGPLRHELAARSMSSDYFDSDDADVVLSGTLMASFFNGVILQIFKLIRKQVEKLQKEVGTLPDAVILVGGLSSSEWVYQEVLRFCSEEYGPGVELLRPQNAWGAIARGAVAYGLDRTAIISRTARRHYLFTAGRVFNEKKHPQNRLAICPIGGKRVRGGLQMLLQKGKALTRNTPTRLKGYVAVTSLDPDDLQETYKVFCSNNNDVPLWEDDPGVYCLGELTVDLNVFKKRWAKKGWTAASFDASKTPIRVALSICAQGGHGAGMMDIKASARVADAASGGWTCVGKLEMNYASNRSRSETEC